MNDTNTNDETTVPTVAAQYTPSGTVWYPEHARVTIEHDDAPDEVFWVPNDNTASTPTTNLACPVWCDGPGNEGFDIEIATGQSIRHHDHVHTRGDGFTVWFAALERITPDGPMTEPITIGIDKAGNFDGLSWLTPTQARAIAAAHLSAADEVDYHKVIATLDRLEGEQ